MRSKEEPARIDGFGATARRIAKWRKTRQGRGRMPEELWREAVTLAGVHGMMPTVRALQLDYGRLKKRVAAAGGLQTAEPRLAQLARSRPAPAFIDVGTAGEIRQRVQRETRAVAGVMAIELTLATGERLTIRVDGGKWQDQCGHVRETRSDI